jgi:pyridoxal phosphate enzyme (YggS family)
VDSLRVAEALHRRMKPGEAPLPILIEVNCSGDDSKFGVAPDTLVSLVEEIMTLDRLAVRGLMTIGPLSRDREETRRAFALLRTLRERAAKAVDRPLPELSMGMSGDYPAAIEEGATLVRIGSAIFGQRRAS